MKETYFNTLIMIFIVGIGMYYMKYYLDKILKGNYNSVFVNFELFEKKISSFLEKLTEIEKQLIELNIELAKFKTNFEERCKHYEFRITKVESKLNGEED
jgi:hypothetical protein